MLANRRVYCSRGWVWPLDDLPPTFRCHNTRCSLSFPQIHTSLSSCPFLCIISTPIYSYIYTTPPSVLTLRKFCKTFLSCHFLLGSHRPHPQFHNTCSFRISLRSTKPVLPVSFTDPHRIRPSCESCFLLRFVKPLHPIHSTLPPFLIKYLGLQDIYLFFFSYMQHPFFSFQKILYRLRKSS